MAQAPCGAQARSYLQTRLQVGSTVSLQPQTIDRNGRALAEVLGEINLGLTMVEDGQAYPLRGPAATSTGITSANATPGTIWSPSSAPPAAASAWGR